MAEIAVQHSRTRIPRWLGIAAFCIAALYFTARGPWRAVGSVNSYDFAAVYGAAQCWLAGENPYDMRLVNARLHAAGDDPATLPNTDPPPSVYLPTAFPLIAPVAVLPYKPARLVWSLVSIAAFLFSGLLLIKSCSLPDGERWLLAAGILLFSPTSSGLSTGNPSVLSCSFTLAAILLAIRNRTLAAILVLGLANCIKPQVSIAAIAVLLLWGYWRTVLLSAIIPAIAILISFVHAANVAQYEEWLVTLHNVLTAISQSGGMNDPGPANYFSYHLVNMSALTSIWIHHPAINTIAGWLAAIALIALYLIHRKRNTAGQGSFFLDTAFFCAVSLIPVYHRYYDAQLLLGVLPWLLATRHRWNNRNLAVWICLLVFLFPLQAIFAEAHHSLNPASFMGFVLLRHQPLTVLLLGVLLVPWGWNTALFEGGHSPSANATVCNSQRPLASERG